MTRRRAMLAGALVLAGLVGWWMIGRNQDKPLPRGESVARAGISTTSTARPDAPTEPLAWLFEPGVAPRRVAGTVSYQGRPVAGATVVLGSVVVDALGQPPPEAVTDAAGAFDLGTQPVMDYVLGATADGRVHSQRLDVRDPTLAVDAVHIELEDCPGMLRGRVFDAGGGVIEGARVTQTKGVPGFLSFAPLYGVVTNERGEYALCSTTTWEVAVSADGYGTVRLSNQSQDHDVYLMPEAQVSGIVLGPDGEPAPDAVVVFQDSFRYRSALSRRVAAGADGRFRIEGLDPGRYALTAGAADAFGEYQEETLHLRPGEVRTDVVLRLAACPRRVAGHVLLGDEPVAGVEVMFGYERAMTQRDGSFVFGCVARRRLDISVTKYELIEPTEMPRGGESMDDLVVRVRARATLRGRVTRDGVGVAGAEVRVVPPGSALAPLPQRERFETATTAADGTYALEFVPPGKHQLEARVRDGGPRSTPVAVTVGSADVDGVDLELDRRGRIEGRVLFEDGTPLTEAGMVAMASEAQLHAPLQSDGTFVFGGVAPGKYHLHHWGNQSYEPVGEWPQVEVTEAAPVARVTVHLRQFQPVAIRGTVLYDDDTPAAGAFVRGYVDDAFADDAGRFALSFEAEHGSETEMQVFGLDGARWKGKVAAGTQDLVVRLERAGAVRGVVRGDAERWRVSLDTGGDYATAVRAGRFRIDGVPPGEYDVQLRPPDDGSFDVVPGGDPVATVRVLAGQEVSLTLERGNPPAGRGRVTGQVKRYPDGQPVVGARCSRDAAIAFVDIDATAADAEARFELRDVPAGPATIGCVRGHLGEPAPLVGSADVTVVADTAVATTVWVIDATDLLRESKLGAVLVSAQAQGSAGHAFTQLTEAGVAARAGIESGDILITVAGASATGELSAVAADYLRSRQTGRVTIEVLRGGAPVPIELVYDEPER